MENRTNEYQRILHLRGGLHIIHARKHRIAMRTLCNTLTAFFTLCVISFAFGWLAPYAVSYFNLMQDLSEQQNLDMRYMPIMERSYADE